MPIWSLPSTYSPLAMAAALSLARDRSPVTLAVWRPWLPNRLSSPPAWPLSTARCGRLGGRVLQLERPPPRPSGILGPCVTCSRVRDTASRPCEAHRARDLVCLRQSLTRLAPARPVPQQALPPARPAAARCMRTEP